MQKPAVYRPRENLGMLRRHAPGQDVHAQQPSIKQMASGPKA